LQPERDAKAELNRRSQACEVLTVTGIRAAKKWTSMLLHHDHHGTAKEEGGIKNVETVTNSSFCIHLSSLRFEWRPYRANVSSSSARR